MAQFVLTRRASADFEEIVIFTRDRWGDMHAARYTAALDDCFHRVAANPSLGRSCDHLLPRARRIEQGKHVVFFRQVGEVVEVLRVLHQRMLPERHLGDAADE